MMKKCVIDPALIVEIRDKIVSVTQPWWRGDFISENGLIYGCNIGGSRPPLFWCFQGYQEFDALAQALGPDQPLYGMRSGHLIIAPSQDDYLHMAYAYAQEILSLGLPEPLVLGGNCQGALLSQKTAQVLMAHDHAVALLIALNPPVITPYVGNAAFIVGRYDKFNPFQRFHDADAILRANLPRCSIDTLPSRHGELFLEPMLTLLVQLLRKHIDTVQDSYCGSFAEWSLQASFEVSAPKTMEPNRIYEIPLTFYNNSGTTLGSKAQSGFSLGNHWCDAGGTVVQWLDGLRPLMHPLEPGNHVDLTLWVRSPHKEGIYQLEIDLEHAGSFWLSELGVKRALSNITVLSPPSFTVSAARPPM